MARHLAPFSWRQRMAETVRRRSFGCVLPLGRHASTNGSKFVHCASDTIALSSFQKEQNARHHKQFKREQALVRLSDRSVPGIEQPAGNVEHLRAGVTVCLDDVGQRSMADSWLQSRTATLTQKLQSVGTAAQARALERSETTLCQRRTFASSS